MSDDSKIDESILAIAAANRHQMKVAMLIVKVATAVDGSVGDDNRLQQVADRIEALVASGQLEGFGNLKRWRQSEVRTLERKA